MECVSSTNDRDAGLTVGAVLLAAGAGARLGGKPKALLELDGVPLIARMVRALRGAGVEQLVVVLGHHASDIQARIPRFSGTVVLNPEPDNGQASSLRLGLQSLAQPLDAVIVALVDQPLISAADISALISGFRRRGDKAMLVPRVRMSDGSSVPGNPVILSSALRAEWLAEEAGLTGRGWRERHPETIFWFDTDNPHYRLDIDTPQDLERFGAMTGQKLRWPSTLDGATD